MSSDNYYQVLGVDEYSTTKEIKNAYRRLATLYHPDKVEHLGPRLKTLADEELKKLNAAKTILLNEEKRREYDNELGIIPKVVTESKRGHKIDWDSVPDEIDLASVKVKGGDHFLYCEACGQPNLQTDELCGKCGVQLKEFQQVELSLNERIHILEGMLQESKITPQKFFEAMRNLETWYFEKNRDARERSMEKRIEILTEKFKNKELNPDKYFEAITNLREWWQR